MVRGVIMVWGTSVPSSFTMFWLDFWDHTLSFLKGCVVLVLYTVSCSEFGNCGLGSTPGLVSLPRCKRTLLQFLEFCCFFPPNSCFCHTPSECVTRQSGLFCPFAKLFTNSSHIVTADYLHLLICLTPKQLMLLMTCPLRMRISLSAILLVCYKFTFFTNSLVMCV